MFRYAAGAGETLTYQPMLLGAAEIQYSDAKSLDARQQLTLLSAVSDGPITVDWSQASTVDLPAEDLEQSPGEGGQFAPLPTAAGKTKNYDTWRKDFASWIYRNQKLELLESPSLELVSNPGETERDFRIRLQQLARERRDEMVEKLRQKYASKIATLQDRKQRAEQSVEREAEQATSQKVQTAISFGATLLSSFMGRKALSLTSLGRATTAARGVTRSMKESADVGRAQETADVVAQQLADLEAHLKTETDAIQQAADSQTEKLEKVSLKPKKSNIELKLLTLVWAPYWRDAQGSTKPAWE